MFQYENVWFRAPDFVSQREHECMGVDLIKIGISYIQVWVVSSVTTSETQEREAYPQCKPSDILMSKDDTISLWSTSLVTKPVEGFGL